MNHEFSDILAELESWYQRDSGRYLFDTTRRALAPMLDTSFGYHILQLGVTRDQPLFDNSPINHRIYAAEQPGSSIGLLAKGDELPLESDSVDTVIAHHSLEFTDNPHQVLREIQRVLTPQGHLLVIGFNPLSLLGLGTRLRGLSSHSLWHHHRPVREARLCDWLHLLGCEVQGKQRLCTIPPIRGGRGGRWSSRCDAWCNRHNLPMGSLYIVHSIKQVSAIHRPNRLRFRREKIIGLTAPAPAPRAGLAAREGDSTT